MNKQESTNHEPRIEHVVKRSQYADKPYGAHMSDDTFQLFDTEPQLPPKLTELELYEQQEEAEKQSRQKLMAHNALALETLRAMEKPEYKPKHVRESEN